MIWHPVSPDPKVSGEEVQPPPLELEEIHRDKLSLIGQMASSIAHELSNPLATIVAASQTVIASWPRPHDGSLQSPIMQQLAEDLELILAEARRAGEIVHGLLASARQHAPERRVISLMAVTKRAASLCRHHLRLHDIVLHGPGLESDDQSPMWSRLEGDANQLHQVLLNLMVNAQHAISGHRNKGNVWLTVQPGEDGYIRVLIEDDGPGIQVEPRERIFEPFFTTKPTGKGTGLGLTISAGIVASHKGRIAVRDRPGGGTVFELTLPGLALQRRGREAEATTAVAEALEQAAPKVEETTPPPRRILLVDDEPGIRQSVSRFLQRRGHLVTSAASGREAMEALRQAPYDAVVSDLRMPDLGGEELYAMMLREFPQMAHRVIFTSGDLMREETRTFLARSGAPALGKPYELDQLVRILNGLCATAPIERRASA